MSQRLLLLLAGLLSSQWRISPRTTMVYLIKGAWELCDSGARVQKIECCVIFVAFCLIEEVSRYRFFSTACHWYTRCSSIETTGGLQSSISCQRHLLNYHDYSPPKRSDGNCVTRRVGADCNRHMWTAPDSLQHGNSVQKGDYAVGYQLLEKRMSYIPAFSFSIFNFLFYSTTSCLTLTRFLLRTHVTDRRQMFERNLTLNSVFYSPSPWRTDIST